MSTTNRWYRKKYNKKDPALAEVTNPITKEHIPLKEKSSVMLGPTETKSCKRYIYTITSNICTQGHTEGGFQGFRETPLDFIHYF